MSEFQIHEYYNRIPIPGRLRSNILDQEKNEIEFIEGLSKVNLFVGTNNSGKSLLLREILKQQEYKNYPSQNIKDLINDTIEMNLSALKTRMAKEGYGSIEANPRLQITEDKLSEHLKKFNDNYSSVQDYVNKGLSDLKRLANISPRSYRIPVMPGRLTTPRRIPSDIRIELGEQLNGLRKFLDSLELDFVSERELRKIYIPTIRSLRKYSSPELLGKKTKSEYDFDNKISIQNGQGMYDAIKNMMMDTYEVQMRKTEYEHFLSKEFFQGKEVRITPNKNQNELTIKIGKEKEQPIYDLGEGLQMILILTFPIFFFQEGILVIEEPEIFLHPGFQHKLMNTFINHPKSKNFIFLISTHSNHILENVNYHDKIAVYSMVKEMPETDEKQKEPNFRLTNLAQPGNNLLQLIGVRNTSVFLSNTTIWVEGVTDMLYLRNYISAYLSEVKEDSRYYQCKQFQEGIHFSFILTGGSSIIHYDFSDEPSIEALKNKVVTQKICGRAFVIVDNDNNKHKNRKERFFKDLEGRFKEIPVIEIENLLSNEVIKETILSFPSCKNIEMQEEQFLSEKEYSKIRLGSYIDDHILENDKTKGRKKFKENKALENSTLNCKSEFCNKAVKHITAKNMTETSTKLVEEILDFVIERN